MTYDTTQRASTTSRGSISFSGLLTVLFIGLKLTGAITWSWWWVLSPIWIGYAIALIVVAICLLWVVLT
jgi:hypothetical protein